MPTSNTSPNIQIWTAGAGGGHGLFKVNGDPGTDAGMTGYELEQFYAATSDNLLTTTIAEGLYRPNDIVFDTVHGKFFIADSDGTGHNRVLQGNIADLLSGAPPALTILYSDGGSGTATRIDNLEVDPNSGQVYFTHGQRFEKVSYDVALQTPTILANFGAGSGNPNGTTNNFIDDFVIDFASGSVYLSSHRVISGVEGDSVTKNYIYQITGLTPTTGAGALTFGGGQVTVLPFDPDDDDSMPNGSAAPGEAFPQEGGTLEGLVISPDGQTLYFATATTLFDDDGDGGDGTGGTTAPIVMMGGVYSYALSGNAAGTYTLIYQQVSGTGPQGLLDDLEIDFATGHWYVSDLTGGTPGAGDEAIWRGSLSGGTPTLFASINNPGGLTPGGFILDHAPTLTSSGAGATATETAGPGSGFSAPVIPLASLDATDLETLDQADQLAGAQVRISGGFNSAPGSAEQLTIGGATAGVLGSGISFSYNSLTGVMTLTGVATFDEYEAALTSVEYSISGDNPDANGAAPTRTLSYSVSDGLLTSDEEDITVNVAGTNDGPVNTTGGPVATNEDAASVAVSGLSVSDLDNASLTVTLSVGRGTLTLASTAGLSFGTGDGTADATMTFSGTSAAINAALAGLSYTPTPDLNGPDTLTMTTSDGVGNDSDNVAISVTAVNDAPTVAGDGTEDAAPIVQDMPSPVGQTVASLFAGQYSDAADQVTGGSSADAFAGIAVTANGSGASGQWQYFNGAIWVDIGPASDGAAVLLSAGTSIRFNPAPGFSGAAPTLTTHLVDASGGALTSGAIVDASVTGGTTRYSAGTVVLSETVLVGNTAPTGVSGTLAVLEVASNGANVGTVVAADPDSSTFTYTLVNDAGGRFDINSATGQVTVQNGLLLDYEQASSHVIRVRVDDNEGGVSEFDMNVTVNDRHGELVIGDNANHTYFGGSETDILLGGLGSDTIRGQGGADIISGATVLPDAADAGDFLYGGTGNDIIDGNGGNDVIAGGADSDLIFGGTGSDTVYGGDSASDLTETGSDVISGGAGNDFLYGNGGNDSLFGGTENDELYGGAGHDELFGEAGIDRLNGGAGADDLTGGSGNDVFVFKKGEANGDVIEDFVGNGSGAGDSIRLEGYAAGTTFTRVGNSDTWKINDHGFIEYITIENHASVHSTDWIIVP
jgi:hypothetical protein